MKRTISSVLALGMIAAMLSIFAGAASAQVTEPSGQIAVVNGASTDPVTADANGTAIGGDLAYADTVGTTILPASGSPFTVTFSDTSATTVALAGMDAFTVVSGYGDNGETAKAYPVEVAPYADASQGKVQVWNATAADVTVNVGSGDVTVAAGQSISPNAVDMAPGTYTITIDGVTRDIDVAADSYTDVFAVNDGTTPAIAAATIASMTDLVAALTPAAGGVAVPNVVDTTEADATAAITGAGLVVGTTTTAADDTIVAGNVISQDPAAGTDVPSGSPVNIVVSTGPDTPATVPVPDVTGKAAADAQAELEAAGFTVASEEQESMDVEAGLVIETNPATGTEVAPGETVTMIVSSGAGEVIVPNFVGMTQEEATAAAEEAGLTISFVEDPQNPDPDGEVASQDPTAGAKAEAGSEVVAQLTPQVDDAWVIVHLNPSRLLTVSGIHFKPGTTVELAVLNTDKKATATVQDDGSWVTTADLSDVENQAELLLVKGTAADESAYEATFKIPAAGSSTDQPTDETATEESSGTPVWVWVVLGLVVLAIIGLGIKIFGGSESADGGDTPSDDTPTTDSN